MTAVYMFDSDNMYVSETNDDRLHHKCQQIYNTNDDHSRCSIMVSIERETNIDSVRENLRAYNQNVRSL